MLVGKESCFLSEGWQSGGDSGLSVPPQKPFPGLLSHESFKEKKRNKLNL